LQNKWNHRYNDSIVRKGGNEFVVNMKKLNSRSNLKSLNISKDESLFDSDLAKVAVSNPVEANLNPLFLNTRQFNNTTIEYKNFKAENEANQSQISTKAYGKSSYKTKSKINSRANNRSTTLKS
jgi:hypothetical protein